MFCASEIEVLADFGEAYAPSTEHRYDSHAPLSVAPPEARFEPDRSLGFSSDIWTLACAFWSVLGQRPLFEDILVTPDDITAEQVDVLGQLPSEWWGSWRARSEYFDVGNKPIAGRLVRSWEDRFESHIQRPRREVGITMMESDEKTAMMDLLRAILCFMPERRLAAQGVLESEWVSKWGWPEYETSLPERVRRLAQ